MNKKAYSRATSKNRPHNSICPPLLYTTSAGSTEAPRHTTPQLKCVQRKKHVANRFVNGNDAVLSWRSQGPLPRMLIERMCPVWQRSLNTSPAASGYSPDTPVRLKEKHFCEIAPKWCATLRSNEAFNSNRSRTFACGTHPRALDKGAI